MNCLLAEMNVPLSVALVLLLIKDKYLQGMRLVGNGFTCLLPGFFVCFFFRCVHGARHMQIAWRLLMTVPKLRFSRFQNSNNNKSRAKITNSKF